MNRRIFIAATALLAVAPTALAATPGRDWDFRVYLDDAPIGHHRYTLHEQGTARELTNEARFTVKVLGVTAYRYTHDARERWQNGCLATLTARTDDNGERLAVSATREGERLAISTARPRTTLDGCVMTFAYWNPAILNESRLLNAQTGEYEAIRVTRLGEERIAVRGTQVNAIRYRITGSKHPIDLWYSAEREWLALESTLQGGRRLRYQLTGKAADGKD